MLRLFLACCAVVLLAGCSVAPETLGISEQQWNQYTPQKQQTIVANYEKVRANNNLANTTAAGYGTLHVGIANGKVMMPPFTASYKYTPIEFDIADGVCREVELHNLDVMKSVDLIACFKQNVLFLDPSFYELAKQKGSIRFYYSPLWESGFAYRNISSRGYARLQQVTVTIKKQ